MRVAMDEFVVGHMLRVGQRGVRGDFHLHGLHPPVACQLAVIAGNVGELPADLRVHPMTGRVGRNVVAVGGLHLGPPLIQGVLCGAPAKRGCLMEVATGWNR